MKGGDGINLPLVVKEGGRTWKLFCVDYESEDSVYSVYIHAINREHASYKLEELKATGRLNPRDLVRSVKP